MRNCCSRKSLQPLAFSHQVSPIGSTTPWAACLIASACCVKKVKTGSSGRAISISEEGLESIKQTVGQLLWTAGRREAEEKHSHLQTVLASVLRYLDYRLKKQGIDYQQELEDDLHLPVAAHDLEELF